MKVSMRASPYPLQRQLAWLPRSTRVTVGGVMEFGRARRRRLSEAVAVTAARHQTSRREMWLRMLRASVRYGFTPKDFLALRLADLPLEEHSRWVSKVLVRELQYGQNRHGDPELLNDKHRFARHFAPWLGRHVYPLSADDARGFLNWVDRHGLERVMFKPRWGVSGIGISVHDLGNDSSAAALHLALSSSGPGLVEEVITQHPSMADLYPGSVNTVRVTTMRGTHGFEVSRAALRIGIDGFVDNLAQGSLAAPIDPFTGTVVGAGVTSDPMAPQFRFNHHPVTGKCIEGVKIPFWSDVMALVQEASARTEGLNSVGWDVAILPTSACLIEGNDIWCHVLWQLPQRRGGRAEALRLLGESA